MYAHMCSNFFIFQLKEVLEKMKSDGKIDLADQIQKIQELKTDNRLKEKKIMSLVKESNKLQDVNEFLEKENFVLR